MQRFTLIHDGSTQGWRTTYLAFHIAARLGAPLKVLLLGADTGQEMPIQTASQIEVGGRAAGLEIETSIVTEFSTDIILNNSPMMNGLFIPRRLVGDRSMMARLLEVFDCPLWIVSEEPETRKMTVLVDNPTEDEDLIAFASMLSQRIGETLTVLLIGANVAPETRSNQSLDWIQLQNSFAPTVISALDQIHTDLLIFRPSHYPLVDGLSCTCVVYNTRSVRA